MRILFVLIALFFSTAMTGQDARLAQQYFRDGEFEKAAAVYEKLFQRNEQNTYYFDRYVDCLLALEEYETCEKVIKKQLRKDNKNVSLYVTFGKLFERQFQDEEAAKQYRLAIENLPRDRFAITKLANAFVVLTKYDLASRIDHLLSLFYLLLPGQSLLAAVLHDSLTCIAPIHLQPGSAVNQQAP